MSGVKWIHTWTPMIKYAQKAPQNIGQPKNQSVQRLSKFLRRPLVSLGGFQNASEHPERKG